MNLQVLAYLLGLAVLLCPAVLLTIVGLPSLTGRPLRESTFNRYAYAANVLGLLAAIGMLGLMLGAGTRFVPIELGHWVIIPDHQFHFHLKFNFDRLSIPFVILTYLLCGTVSAFASRYLHREPGYGRFAVCYALFLLGMIVTSLAGTIEVLFFGWELVGLSSALLVAFFHERTAPVQNGMRVWTVYRLADAALLMAAVLMHHLTGAGDFESFTGTGSWPHGTADLSSQQALLVGLLLLVAAAGKSALVPFSGWLPRAMEGPTPSSAIFYGALSVHLGAFLLLRVSPILDQSAVLSAVVVGAGLVTSIFAALAVRVQTDIKTALAYASLIQVGLIVVEIGVGLRYVALVHILGHACLRTMQLLRAPNLLHDYHTLENAIGRHLAQHRRRPFGRTGLWWYRFAIERGYLDVILNEYLVHPLLSLFQWCDRAERRWTTWLAGPSATRGSMEGRGDGSDEPWW